MLGLRMSEHGNKNFSPLWFLLNNVRKSASVPLPKTFCVCAARCISARNSKHLRWSRNTWYRRASQSSFHWPTRRNNLRRCANWKWWPCSPKSWFSACEYPSAPWARCGWTNENPSSTYTFSQSLRRRSFPPPVGLGDQNTFYFEFAFCWRHVTYDLDNMANNTEYGRISKVQKYKNARKVNCLSCNKPTKA